MNESEDHQKQNPPALTRADFMRLSAAGASALLAAPIAAGKAASPPQLARSLNQQPPDTLTDAFQKRKRRTRGMLTLAYRIDDGAELIAAGQWAQEHGMLADTYGVGGSIEQFEDSVARLLGFEAACFMPTGVMAQLAALRIYADRGTNRIIGLHPTSHHLLHEEDAYSVLHGLSAKTISPWDRPILASNVKAAPGMCAVSVEMPVRWLGGQLQSWSELSALKRAADARDTPLVMDGARLWECGPHYGRSYAAICDGFSAVYVSFYKMVGALNGAILAADKTLIDESKIWRRRLGGDVYQFYPYVLSSAMRLSATLPPLAKFREQARSLCRRLAAHEKIIPLPSEPPTNLFRLILPGERDTLLAKRDDIADATGIWVGDSFRPTRVPGLAQVELQLGPNYQPITEDEAVEAFLRLL